MIPKPGAWMETLKQVFAFPMFLTAAWLLSVLGALAGYRMAAMVVAGAALIAFGIWALKSAGQGAKAILLSVLGLAIIIPVFGLISATSSVETILGLAWLVGLIGAFVLIARMSGNATGAAGAGPCGTGRCGRLDLATGTGAHRACCGWPNRSLFRKVRNRTLVTGAGGGTDR